MPHGGDLIGRKENAMAERSNEEVVRQYFAAHVAHDYDLVGTLRDADWTTEWPQSGERVRGHANDRAIMDNWPGGLPTAGNIRVVGSEDRWVMTPAFTMQRVVGNGDFWWGDGTASYPDGGSWFVAALLEVRNGKILRETWYFAPPLEPPAWRAPWVERTT
jgi:ketosteroid isomerase-like protein